MGDLHWPLLTGKLTEASICRILAALSAACYRGALALELSPRNPDPIAALRDGMSLLHQLLRRN